MKPMLQSYGIGVLALSAVITAGCARTEQARERTEPAAPAVTEREMASVRFINASPGAKSYDLFFGEQKAFSGIDYKSATPFQQFPAERREFRLVPAGEGLAQSVAANSEGLDGGDNHTIVAITNTDGTMTLGTFDNDLRMPSSGKAKVRVIHAATGAGELDIVPAGQKDEMFEGVDFNSATPYVEVAPFTGALEVRKENENRVLLRIPDANLEAGKLYTIVITGGRNGTALEAMRLEDQSAPAA